MHTTLHTCTHAQMAKILSSNQQKMTKITSFTGSTWIQLKYQYFKEQINLFTLPETSTPPPLIMLPLESLGYTNEGDPRTWLKSTELHKYCSKRPKQHTSSLILQVKAKGTEIHVTAKT